MKIENGVQKCQDFFFVIAAKGVGCSDLVIVERHILYFVEMSLYKGRETFSLFKQESGCKFYVL